MAYAANIFCVSGVANRPVLHLDLSTIFLSLPNSIQEHIYGAFRRHLSGAVEHRDAKDETKALLASRVVLLQDSMLSIELRLSVQVGGSGWCVNLVGCFALLAGEDVVGRYIDEQDGALGTQLC